MSAAKLVLSLCSAVGLSCAASPPDASVIQEAYEHEASSGSRLHDKGLRVIKADCDDLAHGQYLCQVTYLSKDDPDERLYFDVIAVARAEQGWALKSGLCKR